jgi:hypothetical protein
LKQGMWCGASQRTCPLKWADAEQGRRVHGCTQRRPHRLLASSRACHACSRSLRSSCAARGSAGWAHCTGAAGRWVKERGGRRSWGLPRHGIWGTCG